MKKRKKAFSLLEIIFAVIVGGLIMYFSFTYIYDTYFRSSSNATISSDIQNIYKGALEWKERSSNSDGTWSNISNSELLIFLPSKMELVDGCIQTVGSEKGICYSILSDKSSLNGDTVKIFADFTKLKSSKRLGDRETEFLEVTIADTIKKYFGSKGNVIKTATSIGTANSSLSSGGTTTDALVGVEKLTL
ncbi:hypothetical protein [Aliarcobacter butzleri]|uniref:hypothetical protein n=1 Tax=Aliarcobacter butzleri TaxID=28197 RepID=UPI002B24D08C|nr:hypothetical protein [Aliarcobacter butzleri]